MLMLDQTPLTSTPTCGRNHRNGRAVWTETGGRFPPKSEGGFSRNLQYHPPTAPDALKKQQMQWSKKGAHRLLQTRTRTLDGTLHDLFTSWYPAMPANDVQPASFAAAA